MKAQQKIMQKAINLAEQGMASGSGGPFGCVIVKDGKIIASAHNEVISSKDPTAHAEVVAIRRACKTLDNFQLDGCEIFTSCEPCPMCLGAIYWARPKRVYYACSKNDAASIGFDDQFIYKELEEDLKNRSIPFIQISSELAFETMKKWMDKSDKQDY